MTNYTTDPRDPRQVKKFSYSSKLPTEVAARPPGDGGEWVLQAAYQVLSAEGNRVFQHLWGLNPIAAVSHGLTEHEMQNVANTVEQFSFDLPGGESGKPVQDALASMEWVRGAWRLDNWKEGDLVHHVDEEPGGVAPASKAPWRPSRVEKVNEDGTVDILGPDAEYVGDMLVKNVPTGELKLYKAVI